MQTSMWIGLLRQALQVLGGFLIANGLLSEELLEPFIGFLLNAAVLAWWLWEKYAHKVHNEEAIEAAHEHGKRVTNYVRIE